jgi:hypothetical protein
MLAQLALGLDDIWVVLQWASGPAESTGEPEFLIKVKGLHGCLSASHLTSSSDSQWDDR